MTKYLYRTCPKCKDYLGVVVRDPPGPKSEIPIDAYSVVCGFKLNWRDLMRIRVGDKMEVSGRPFAGLSDDRTVRRVERQGESELGWQLAYGSWRDGFKALQMTGGTSWRD